MIDSIRKFKIQNETQGQGVLNKKNRINIAMISNYRKKVPNNSAFRQISEFNVWFPKHSNVSFRNKYARTNILSVARNTQIYQ